MLLAPTGWRGARGRVTERERAQRHTCDFVRSNTAASVTTKKSAAWPMGWPQDLVDRDTYTQS